MNRLDAKICVSEPARTHMMQYFAGHYDVVPNGIDIDRFGERMEPFPWATPGTPRILFVGRYNEARKGFKYLLRAMPLIQQQFPNAQLLVVGPGDPERFRETIDRYQIRNVEFRGEVSAESLPHYYSSSDVFCALGDLRESRIVLLEAMASMKPVSPAPFPVCQRSHPCLKSDAVQRGPSASRRLSYIARDAELRAAWCNPVAPRRHTVGHAWPSACRCIQSAARA